jgi:hypothetical protein
MKIILDNDKYCKTITLRAILPNLLDLGFIKESRNHKVIKQSDFELLLHI